MDRSQRLAPVDRLLPWRRPASAGPRGRRPGRFAARGLRSLPALLVLLLASCQGDADFSPIAPPPTAPAAGPAPAPSSAAVDLPVAVRGLMSELDAQGSSYPQPARLVAIGEQLLPYGAAARPAAAPLANWLRYYSYSSLDPAHEALLRRLGSIVRALDPEASYYGDRRFQYGPDKSDQDRARTITFLFYGPLPRERVVPVFVAAMADPEEWIRDLAAAGLVQYGEPVPADPRPFSERVVSTSPRANEGALAEFRSLDAPARTQRIRSLLASGNERDAAAVGRLYDRDRDPLIRSALLDALSDPAARRSSLTVLLDTRIAVPGDRVPFLLAGMGDEQPEVREAARRTLLRCGPTPRVLVPMLIAGLESGPPAQRPSAAAALKEITGRDFGLDAETWRLWREAKLEGEPPQLLLPGPHHGSEVPLNADGAWWAICGPKGRRELKQVPVFVRLVNDAVLDAASEETGAEAVARGCEEPLLFLRNVAGLKPRALTEGTVLPIQDGVASLRYGTEDLAVRRFRTGESGFRLELHSAGRTQTLFTAETGLSGDPEPWSVSWVGDLDGDGRADLLLEATEDENVGQTFLFLSGPAPPGVPLKLVATYRTVGC